MERSLEQRYAIKFCVRLGKNATETFQMLQKAFKDNCISRSQSGKWHKAFKEGREEVADEPRSGRPTTARTDEDVDRVLEVLRTDHRLSIQQIADTLHMSTFVVHGIVTEDLQMCKKELRVLRCQVLLDLIQNEPDFLNSVVTGDESWMFEYDPESKRQSCAWHTKSSPRPKKARMSKSRIKTMIIVFFDIRGIVHCEFVPQGQTVNSVFYLEVLRRLKRRISRVRTDIKDTVKLHHDNATSHTAFIITNFLARSNTPLIPDPPYSPDLAPCDFFLFPRLKREMKGKHWETVENIQHHVTTFLRSIPVEEFQGAFQAWQTRLRKESSQQFLTKSLLAFVLFNVLIYSLLAAQLFLLHSSPLQVGNLFQAMIASALTVLVTTVFNGLYALLMLVVLTFFLIYGINMFVKLRGQFAEATGERLETDHWQVQQSRLGLVSLTVLLGGTAGLLACEGPLAQSPVPHRNAHQLAIRVAELAVAIWFPCALWNCACPAQLWLLNPRRLWRPLTAAPTGHGEGKALVAPPAGTECWICYDSQRTDAGPLIQPCRCRGDGGAVHHDCLRKWLVQSLRARCAVCGENYQLAGTKWRPAPAPWLRAVAVVLVTSATVGGCGLALRLLPSPGLRVLALGLAMVSLHLGLRLLGFSLLSALRRSRLASVRILHRPPSTTILDPTAPAAPMGEHLALTGTSGAHPCPSTL
ncbi:hypothetical protein LAZ67_7002482 [Cordylochernes scorpioides]|uniref:RING-CH-type domain-containing protein n=1 Tax=Cordylochernes scorpioides TaxID=51811 RepID=A0ABY6KR47_9ARAC|nr:hypothetical protein LAZ67_7002482 [Cordylochernes scorpioides]